VNYTPYIALSLLSSLLVEASTELEFRQKLRCNMTIQNREFPKKVDSLTKMLLDGRFYGRFRMNSFVYNNKDNERDHEVVAVGGSLTYHSAYFNGFGLGASFYTSQTPWQNMSQESLEFYKGGKDTLSRYDISTGKEEGLTSLAQAFVEYRGNHNRVKIGRQLFESFLTKSNDTKMIPNSFEGVSFENRSFTSTTIKTAILTRQKLKDHSDFHHVLAYGDNPNDAYAKWSENDDGAMHQGLTISRLNEKGIEDRLLIFDIKNSAITNTTLNANYTAVPELLSSMMVEGSYRFVFKKTKLIPSVRYMAQFDNGAGAIGGANLKDNTIGYDNPDSLDGSLFATRLDVIQRSWSLRFGYSSVADKGDIVAPWRGFPTAGYTRAMGQYNWNANTDTYLLRADYNLDKAGLLNGGRLMMRYAVQNFDDAKAGVSSDKKIFTINLVKRGFLFTPNLYAKIRMAFIDGKSDTIAIDGSLKPDSSYTELRFEINYLF